MQNIALSALAITIERASQNTEAKGTKLDSESRDWLSLQVISGEEQLVRYRNLMKQLSYVNTGRKFTREEMNER